MKKLAIVCMAVVFGFALPTEAQTAEEIIDTYFENTGGIENWEKIETLKISGKVNQQGMEIPITVYNVTDGKSAFVINFQGKEIKQNVFDGETMWSTNFMTQKAEKSDAETTAMAKLEANDYPDPFLNYKEKGYTIENMGKEDFNGTEVFKIKLVKEPVTIDGKEEESISYYYFDTENYVPIAVHTEVKMGPQKGAISEVTLSDYQEVNGVYMPFSMTQGLKGQPGMGMVIESIEVNTDIDDSMFKFPEEEMEKKEGN